MQKGLLQAFEWIDYKMMECDESKVERENERKNRRFSLEKKKRKEILELSWL